MTLSVFLVLLLLGTCSAYENLALRGKATQSDRYEHAFGDAYSAIDGNRDSNFNDGSCTHTSGKPNPWWRVDLLESCIITSITIINRGDCCQERINGLQIHIGDSLDDNGLNNTLVGQIDDLQGSPTFTKIFLPPLVARYVTLLLPGAAKFLTLCEVEVYGYRYSTASNSENLALHGKATQSDCYEHAFGAAYNAIDGNRDSNFNDGSCTHTSGKPNPWWRVDLLESCIITSITIINRGDCCQERINGLQIHISDSLDDNGLNNTLVGQIDDLQGSPTFTKIFLPPLVARYVTLLLPGAAKYLTVCEVEVYGYRYSAPGENLALQGNAAPSSLLDFGLANNAIYENESV